MANASPPAKSSKPDDALLIALLAGDSGLSRRGLTALWRLRQRQREIMRGSRGAFVKVKPRKQAPFLDLGQIGRDSPLTADYHSLVVLELAREFPEHGDALRSLLDARRAGLDASTLAEALWQPEGAATIDEAAARYNCDGAMLAATLRIALKPLYESVAEAFLRHFPAPAGGATCPVCGGPPWARRDDELKCSSCESIWQGAATGDWRPSDGVQPRGARRFENSESTHRLIELEDALFAQAYEVSSAKEFLLALELHIKHRQAFS